MSIQQNKNRALALMLCAAFLLAGKSQAAQIQGVTIAAESSQYAPTSGNIPDNLRATNVLTSTGLFGDDVVTQAGDVMWETSTSLSGNPASITFNLGASHTVNAIKVWNWNGIVDGNGAAGPTNGVKLVNISYSTDGVNFTTNQSAPGVTTNYTFNEASGTFGNSSQIISSNMGFTAQYVRFDIITNWALANSPVGLSKVRFMDNSVPPTILSATENYGSNQVTVNFSESVNPASATTVANYSVTNGAGSATIVSAAMGEFANQVILQTSPLANQSYNLVASNVKDEALTTAIANNATAPVMPELILWLQANTGVVTNAINTSSVTQWNDQSGYGHNAVTNFPINFYPATSPTILPGVLNGLPAVSFTGGISYMEIPTDANLTINGDMTLCIVLEKTTTTAGHPINKTGGVSTTVADNGNGPGPFDPSIATTGTVTLTWGNGAEGSAPTTASTGALALNQYYILSIAVHGTNVMYYTNAIAIGTENVESAPADSGNPIFLGIRLDSANTGTAATLNAFTGNIAEVMLVRGTVTVADLAGMNIYLGAKYGITVPTLVITEQPGSITATNGQTATFWINVEGLGLTYQWRSNNVAITGATNAVYTTPTLASSYNGAQYTVALTAPGASATSAAAILTVVPATLPPTVFSASKSSANASNIVVVYSETVSNATALNPANYSLNGVAPVSAVAGSQSNVVVLTAASALTNTTSYFLTIQNVQDVSANTIAPATVPVFPANMALWLRADVGVLTDTSGNVSEWLDQTANTNNASQYSGGSLARPTPFSGQINGEPALNFNSANSNYLQITTSPSVAIAADMSVFVEAQVSDYSAAREFLGKTAGAAGNIPASYDYYVQNSTTLRFYRGNGAANALVVATQAPSAGVPHLMAATMQGTTVNQYLDGNANGSGTLNTNMADGGTPLKIGTRNDFAQFMNGDIAEIMLFSQALSNSDLTTVNDYLGVKYFPFSITNQPASTNTQEGVTATFSVGAMQGGAQFTYQWLSNSVSILNATNISYTTAILTTNNSGDAYTVEVIVPGYATNLSNPATVTVNNVPPAIVSAGTAVWNPTEIVVVFTEAVDPATATNPNNYSLTPGASVLSAAIGDTPNKVVLTISPLTPGTAYTLTVQNVQDLFGNTMVTAPTSVGIYPASTALWIMAGSGVTTDANGVNQWNDLSGYQNNLTQTFGRPYEPQLVPNAMNGLPVIRFTSTNETFMSAGASSSLAITGDMSIFAVVNFNGLVGNTNGEIVAKTLNNEPGPFDYYSRNTTVAFYRGNGAINGSVVSTSPPTPGVPHLLDVVMQGTTVTHRLDGSPNGSGTLSTTITDTGTPLYIGTRVDTVNRLNGDLAELIILSAAADSNDVMSIESYLGAKYGLAVAPVITQQPVAATNVDQNGTLVVPAAVAGASPLSLQWYDTSNVAVSGQTNATLVISNMAANDSYYLSASNAFGATNSTTVAVTILTGLTVSPLTPASFTAFAGSLMSYSVTALGTAPFYYQWFEDGAAIANATNSIYELIVQPGTNIYSCTVSNAYHGGTTASSGDASLIGLNPSTNLYTLTVLSNNPIAYWRLNETNGSTIAYDQIAGHNAAYNNVLLGVPGFNPPLDPDTAAQFGLLAASNSYAGEIDNSGSGIPNIDFSQPSGNNAEFSVEAWVKSTNAQVLGAGLVAKGYGDGGEQFDLDVYNAFRFFVRDTSGGVHGPTSTVTPVIGQWYHVAGVCDEANGAVHLYVNGVDVADSTGIASGLGLQPGGVGQPGANLVSLGARTSASTSAFNLQFDGVMDEVALYNYALSSNQVQADYQIGSLLLPPALTIANAGANQVQLSWNAGTLQSATNLAGPFTNLTNALSPYIIPASNAQQFYRVLNN